MIVCSFKDLEKYRSILNYLPEALRKVEELKKAGLIPGRYDYGDFFINVQRGTTKPLNEGRFETHIRYVDIQYEIEGSELMAYAPRDALKDDLPYDEKNDIAFFSADKEDTTIAAIKAGMCYIVFPEDGHMPCRYIDKPTDYTKLVIKLPVKK
jgi:YhcH/YjgK/YiaL family protein